MPRHILPTDSELVHRHTNLLRYHVLEMRQRLRFAHRKLNCAVCDLIIFSKYSRSINVQLQQPTLVLHCFLPVELVIIHVVFLVTCLDEQDVPIVKFASHITQFLLSRPFHVVVFAEYISPCDKRLISKHYYQALDWYASVLRHFFFKRSNGVGF